MEHPIRIIAESFNHFFESQDGFLYDFFCTTKYDYNSPLEFPNSYSCLKLNGFKHENLKLFVIFDNCDNLIYTHDDYEKPSR